MRLNKITATVLSSLTALVSLVSTASGAQASKQISGVAIPGPSTRATSVFRSVEPAYELYPSYLVNTANTGRFGAGVNLPALYNGNGIVPNLGNFQNFQIYYAVPNKGPSAGNGLQVVIQTADGFSRVSNPSSIFVGPLKNNYYVYRIELVPSDFSPSFTAKVLRTASVRYSGTIGPIHFFFPEIIGEQDFIRWFDWNYKTNADTRYNNQ
ncbi:MAG: hypothetical protein JST89_21710 [Cyanobacteria bacterium SZAS-4]|nr:hypothetical protein [Cyanobacteria bacterium SZAS-4]